MKSGFLIFILLLTLVVLTSCGSARRPRRYKGGRGRSYGGGGGGGNNVISSGTQCTLEKRPGGGGANCFSEQECGQVGSIMISRKSDSTITNASSSINCIFIDDFKFTLQNQSQIDSEDNAIYVHH